MASSRPARRRSSPTGWRCSTWRNSFPTSRLVARQSKVDLVAAAKAFFAVTESFRISRIEDAVRSISVTDYYDGLALSRAADTIGAARRGIAVSALSAFGTASQIRSAHGWRPAASGSRGPASACRR